MKLIHRSCVWTCLTALMLVALSAGAAHAQEPGRGTPRPEVQGIVQAITDAVNGADPAVDKLVKEHFAAEYRAARTAEERRKWFEPIRAKYGKITVSELRRTGEDTFVIVATGDKDAKVNLVVTHDDKFMVSGLRVDEPGGE